MTNIKEKIHFLSTIFKQHDVMSTTANQSKVVNIKTNYSIFVLQDKCLATLKS